MIIIKITFVKIKNMCKMFVSQNILMEFEKVSDVIFRDFRVVFYYTQFLKFSNFFVKCQLSKTRVCAEMKK